MNQSKYILEDGVIWPRDEWEDENSDGLRAIELRESEAVAEYIEDMVKDASYGDGTAMRPYEGMREHLTEAYYADFTTGELLEIEGDLDREFAYHDRLQAEAKALNTTKQ